MGAAIAAVVVLGVVATAPAASIDTIVPTGNYNVQCIKGDTGDGMTVCLTDNAAMSYYWDSTAPDNLEQDDRSVVAAVMSEQFNTTDLQVAFDSTPVYEGGGETDVIFREAEFAEGVVGVYWCNDPVDGTRHRCDQGYVTISGVDNYSYKNTCHEAGHSVGLVHGSDASPRPPNADSDDRFGCMQTPLSQTGNALGALNRQNINEIY